MKIILTEEEKAQISSIVSEWPEANLEAFWEIFNKKIQRGGFSLDCTIIGEIEFIMDFGEIKS